MGPLYHLNTKEKMIQCINEAKRLCKPGGKLLFTYISNDMVFVTEAFLYNKNPLRGENYHPQTYKIKDTPFVFLTVDMANDLMNITDTKVITQFAAEGLSELMQDNINELDDSQFKQWFGFHLYACEKKELLGFSNHIGIIAEK